MTVKIEGMEAVVKKLDSLGKPGAFKRPMTRAVKHLYGKMKKEPRKSGTWSAWADRNPASRRAYWAKVASGEASHGPGGYQRSHKLQGGWKQKVSPNGRRGEVYNEVPYGKWVQGLKQISPHADSRYPRTDQVAEKELSFIVKIFDRAIDAKVSGRLVK